MTDNTGWKEAMDAAARAVADNQELLPHEKCLLYYSIAEWFVYKVDPTFKLDQFKFETQEDSNGRVIATRVIRQDSSKPIKYWKYIPTILGPVIGAIISAVLR